VFAATLGAFAAGFGLGGLIAARGLGLPTSRLARTGVACAGAGAAGGVLALLPYAWSLLGLRFPGDVYPWMALTVMAFLGCVIVPFYWMGAIIARESGDGATATSDARRRPRNGATEARSWRGGAGQQPAPPSEPAGDTRKPCPR
jgi:hypothetical protein